MHRLTQSFVFAGLTTLGGPACLAAQVDAFLVNPIGSNWSTSVWSTGTMPNNGSPAGTTYRAFLNIGGFWSVNLNVPVALDALSLDSANGTVRIRNALTLNGPLDRVNGSMMLDGGSVHGATIDLHGGSLFFSSSLSNVLDGTTVAGTLDMKPLTGADIARFVIRNGLTLNGTMQFRKDTALWIDGSQTVHSGTLKLDQGSQGINVIRELDSAPGSVLTFGSGVSLEASNGTKTALTAGGLVNHGVISVDGSGGGSPTYLTLNAGSLHNTGTISVTNGGELILGSLTGEFTNTGTISAVDSTLGLGGIMDSSVLPTIQTTNSRVIFAATVQNGRDSITLDATTGSWEATGGRINGGTVNLLDGATFLFNSLDPSGAERSLTLDRVQLNGDLTLEDLGFPSSTLSLTNGLVLNGTIEALGGKHQIRSIGTQAITGGTLVLAGAGQSSRVELGVYREDGQASPVTTLTISPTTRIEGGHAEIEAYSDSGQESNVNNLGTIVANRSGAPLDVWTDRFMNAGTLEATNGGTLSIAPQIEFVSNGLIRVNDDGVFRMSGPAIRFEAGTVWERSGGTVILAGTVQNAGKTLTLDASTGDWNVEGGAINGGTVATVDGSRFLLQNAGGGGGPGSRLTLNGVSLGSAFDQGSTGGDLGVVGGLDFGGHTLTLSANSAKMSVLGSQTFDNGTLNFDVEQFANANRTVTLWPLTTLTLGPDMVVSGGGGQLGKVAIDSNEIPSRATTLINLGTISVTPGRYLEIGVNRFENDGHIEVAGWLDIEDDRYNSWANRGTIEVLPGGTLRIGGSTGTSELGSIQNDGEVVFEGSLNNDGQTLIIGDSAGVWRLASEGVIKGGTIETRDGNVLRVGQTYATLTDVALEGDALVEQFATLRVTGSFSLDGTITLQGTDAGVRFNDTTTLTGGTIVFDPAGGGNPRRLAASVSTLTLGPDVVVRGGLGRVFTSGTSTIINQGLISADITGQTITVYTERFFNEGTVEAINGGIIEYFSPAVIESLALRSGPSTATNMGLFLIGPSSLVVFPSDFAQLEEGTITVRLGERGAGRLQVEGTAILGGALVLATEPGFSPSFGATYTVLDLGAASGWFTSVELPSLGAGLYWDVASLESDGVVRVLPAPGAGALLLGFACAAFAQRRRTGNGGAR